MFILLFKVCRDKKIIIFQRILIVVYYYWFLLHGLYILGAE